jgi:cystathionine beta-lyase/cystathionine gamma-synthase
MSYAFATRAIHAGQPNDPIAGSVTFPIHQTSTFGQSEIGGAPAYCYARTGNPTRTALEENLAALENASHALAFASGMSAINNVLNLLSAGDHVIACQDLYGGAYRIFTKLYAKFGVEFTFVDTTNPDNIRKAVTDRTKIVWLETPSNPLLKITDIAACSAVAKEAVAKEAGAKEAGAWTVVDNTFATPYLQQPLTLGADIIIHSTTKYLNGHSDVLGGAVITDDNDIAEQLRFFQNCVGSVPGPQDCYLVLRGIKTLDLRLERHCASTRKIAVFLANHPAVNRVYYPGLPSHPGHDIARRQLRDFGGIISFELKGDIDAVKRFAKSAKLWTLAESLGGVKSLFCNPATMTHAAVEPEVRRANGLSDGLIRLSVGLEDAEDLIQDLDQAITAAIQAGNTQNEKTKEEKRVLVTV